MKDHFKDLLEYNLYFNQLLIQNFLDNNPVWSEKGKNLLNHILNAHQIWNARILNQDTFGVWQINVDDLLLKINSDNYTDSCKILDEKNFDEIITYKTSKGQEFNNSIQGILFHLINHSTYHRGQVVTQMKEAGLEPIATDYIFFKRNH